MKLLHHFYSTIGVRPFASLSYYKPKTIRFIVCCSCSDPAKAKCKVDDGNDEAHEE